MIETRLTAESVDILLIAEGTYPFAQGGVATWILDIIVNLPEYKFGIIFLGAYEELYGEYAYPIPENVVHLQLAYLFSDKIDESNSGIKKNKPVDFEGIIKIHEVFKNSHGCPNGLIESIEDIGNILDPVNGVSYYQFLRSEEAWDYILEQYSKFSSDPSFINYFWNIRSMHAPLWIFEEAMNKAPLAKVVHTTSTGYAGLLAAMLHQRNEYPLILSEHGIYTKERSIELLQSKMIIGLDALASNRKDFTYQHELWIRFFDSLARMCYHYSDSIISLYPSAQNLQIFGGADINKVKIIPNGVDVAKFATARRPVGAAIPKIVGFVGRFVRIKDIRTFIRAVANMVSKDDSIIAWIKVVGDADIEYKQECLDYIQLLSLEDRIKFILEGDMLYVLSHIGLLIVSSISEGMPLVVLESMAAGVPVITTDVGCCRVLIDGHYEADKQLGSCGQVVAIGDAVMLADAAVRYLNDSTLWNEASRIGIARVEQYYNQPLMIDAYKEIYQKAISEWQG